MPIPKGVVTATDTVGNPGKSMGYSLDCYLVTLSNIDLIYFKVIWQMVMPFFYIISFMIIYFGLVAANVMPFKYTVVTTALIYMFIYL